MKSHLFVLSPLISLVFLQDIRFLCPSAVLSVLPTAKVGPEIGETQCATQEHCARGKSLLAREA